MKYVILLQIKENVEKETEYMAIEFPECNDIDASFLYKALSYFALKNWVHICGVIPGFECGCLPEQDVNFWKSHLVKYEDLIKD